MDQKTFSLVAGIIFAVVALFHLVRIFEEWTVIIGDWSVPTLTPHSIIPGDACFAYFNKNWGIPY